MIDSKDEYLAAVAAKSIKEATYHVRHSSTWVKRLGDGTQLSKQRMQAGVDEMWLFTPEMFESDEIDQRMLSAGIAADLDVVKQQWQQQVTSVLDEATLDIPDEAFLVNGGRQGVHTQHMGYLLAEMQILPRSFPGCDW